MFNNIPAPPPGFVLDEEPGTDPILTPPAPGTSTHAIDPAGLPTQAPDVPPPPPGFVLDSQPDDLLTRERKLKAEGGGPPTTGQEVRSLDTEEQVNSAGYSMMHNMAEELGNFVGLSAESINLLRPLFGAGMPSRPGEMFQKTQALLKSLGLPTEKIENVAGRFGTNLVDNVLLTLATYGGASAAVNTVKNTPVGTAAQQAVAKTFGKFPDPADLGFGERLVRNYVVGMTEAPAQQVGAAVAGSAGQAIGQGEFNDDPMAGFVGYGITAPLGARVGRMGAATGRAIWRALDGKKATEQLFPTDPLLPAATAQQRVDAHVTYIEKKMRDVVQSQQPTKKVGRKVVALSPQEADDALRDSLDTVYTNTRQIEDTYWMAVNPKQRVVTDDIKANVQKYHNRLMDEESERVLPDDFIQEVHDLPAVVPASKVLGLTTSIYGARKAMERNPTFRGSKERAASLLNELEDLVREGLAREVDNPQALADARAFTAERKRLFNEGPIGAARYADRVKGEEYTKPLSEQVLGRIGGSQQMQSIDTFAKGQGMQATLMDDFETALRATFAEQQLGRPKLGGPGTEIPDPTAADRWISKHANELKPVNNLLRDLDTQVNNLVTLKDMHNRALKSVWAQYAKHPDSAPGQIISANNPNMVKDAINATNIFLDPKTGQLADPVGLRAWQMQVTMNLAKMANHEPQRLAGLVQRPDVQKMLKGVFRHNPDILERYLRLVSAASAEDINRGGAPTALRTIGVLVARISGARVGRRLAPGTVQGPAVISDSFKKGITGWLNRKFPEAPGDILTWAMLSPEGEQWLLSRVPGSIPELRRSIVMARRAQAVFNTGMDELMHRRDPDGREWTQSLPESLR